MAVSKYCVAVVKSPLSVGGEVRVNQSSAFEYREKKLTVVHLPHIDLRLCQILIRSGYKERHRLLRIRLGSRD